MGREQKARRGGAAVAEPELEAPALPPEELERIAGEVKRMNVSERIAFWDKQQARKVHVLRDGVHARILTDADKVDRVIPLGDGRETTVSEWPAGTVLERHPDVKLCPNDPSHGIMTCDKSGALLMCAKVKAGAGCTGAMPVSI